MAFTFNWAGFGNPEIKGGSSEYLKSMRDDFGNAGAAVRGWRIDKANKEYSDLLEGRSKSVNRVAEIKQEIARLEQRNSFIDQQISQLSGTAVQPLQVEPEGGMGWDVNASKALADY